MYKISIPPGAKAIITGLRYANHEAYVVGGCVRDSLLGITPKDWDICTSATPDEMKELFQRNRIRTIDTGLKHGTITANMESAGMFEVTTFRIDGDYSDMRHPDSVVFTESITKDLARRDFTINAMAYNPAGLIDPYGGRQDLESGVIRCVGNPDDRFKEDALRILRALRFSSTYGFSIEAQTSAAIHRNRFLLKHIASERIQSEMNKILLGKGVLNVLLEYSDVFAVFIPEFSKCIGFNQNNSYHKYNVYDHIAYSVAHYTGSDISVKVALFLHDIGKPLCYSEDHNGGHFYGHPLISGEIAETILNRLRFDTKTKNEVLELVLHHDDDIHPTIKSVKRWLYRIGYDQFMRLIDVNIADSLAHMPGTQDKWLAGYETARVIANQIIEQEQCFSLKNLEINGHDLLALGFQEGKEIGTILNEILIKVIDGDLPNNKVELLEYAKGVNHE